MVMSGGGVVLVVLRAKLLCVTGVGVGFGSEKGDERLGIVGTTRCARGAVDRWIR